MVEAKANKLGLSAKASELTTNHVAVKTVAASRMNGRIDLVSTLVIGFGFKVHTKVTFIQAVDLVLVWAVDSAG